MTRSRPARARAATPSDDLFDRLEARAKHIRAVAELAAAVLAMKPGPNRQAMEAMVSREIARMQADPIAVPKADAAADAADAA